DPLFAPSWIIRCHIADHFSEVGRNPGTTAWTRFPLPKQPKSFPMPTEQCVGFHDGQGRLPVEKRHKLSEDEAGRIGCSPRLLFSLHIHCELFAVETDSRQLWLTRIADAGRKTSTHRSQRRKQFERTREREGYRT